MEDKERAKGKEVDEKRRHIEWLSKTSLSGQSGNQPKAKTIRVNMISDLLGQAEDYPNLASPGSSDTKTGPGFYSEPKRLYSAPVLAELIQVESKQAELQKAKLELIKLIEEVVGDFRLAGDAHYINYEFTKALRTYQGGLKYVTKDEIPTLWADMQILIGNANNEIANHSDGPAIAEHRQAALAAYEQSLNVYTKDVFLKPGPEYKTIWLTRSPSMASELTEWKARVY